MRPPGLCNAAGVGLVRVVVGVVVVEGVRTTPWRTPKGWRMGSAVDWRMGGQGEGREQKGSLGELGRRGSGTGGAVEV